MFTCEGKKERIWQIDPKSKTAVNVLSASGRAKKSLLNGPKHLLFDRTPTTDSSGKPIQNPLLYITCKFALRRYNIQTRELITLELVSAVEDFDPTAMDWLPSGLLVVTCQTTHSVWVVDPKSGKCNRLAGLNGNGLTDGDPLTTARFDTPVGVAVASHNQCVYILEYGSHIRGLVVSPHLFQPPSPPPASQRLTH